MTLHRFWWQVVPRAAGRPSRRLLGYLLDGLYWVAWPAISAWLSPALLIVGFLIGWLHPGFRDVFSESLIFLAFATAVGTLSSHLGLFLTVGYALGDFFLAHPAWTTNGSVLTHIAQERLPLLIQYVLLGILTVRSPLVTKVLVDQLRFVVRFGRTFSVVVAFAAHALFTVLVVFLWTQTVPLLIRPVFTWVGRNPPVGAIEPVQTQFWLLLAVAALASPARMFLQSLTAFRQPWRARYGAVLQRVAPVAGSSGLFDRAPELLKIIWTAVFGAFMLAGLYTGFIDGLLVGAVLFLIQAARARLIPVPLGAWPRIVERIPVLVRLLLVGLSIYVISRPILAARFLSSANTFRPLLVMTLVAMVVFYLLSPVRADLLAQERPAP